MFCDCSMVECRTTVCAIPTWPTSISTHSAVRFSTKAVWWPPTPAHFGESNWPRSSGAVLIFESDNLSDYATCAPESFWCSPWSGIWTWATRWTWTTGPRPVPSFVSARPRTKSRASATTNRNQWATQKSNTRNPSSCFNMWKLVYGSPTKLKVINQSSGEDAIFSRLLLQPGSYYATKNWTWAEQRFNKSW